MGLELGLLAAAAGSSYLKKTNQDKALRGQDAEAERGEAAQRAIREQSEGAINRYLTGVQNSSPEAARLSAQGGFMDRLRAARARALPQSGSVGGSRFRQDIATAGQGVSDYGSRLADVLARVKAPSVQRRQEAQNAAQLGSDIQGFNRQSDEAAYQTQKNIGKIRPNPWVDFGADVIGGFGSTLATKPTKPKTSYSGPHE